MTKKNAIQEDWVILNYDLGLKGEYESLYAFLDNHKAVECGKSCAAFQFPYTGGQYLTHDEKLAQIQKGLTEKVSLKKGDRIYAIVHNEVGAAIGAFIFGHRQRPDWEGYGDKGKNDGLPF